MNTWSVTGHIPPRRPIDLRPVWPASAPREQWEVQLEEMAVVQRRAQGERIWAITRQVAEGVNPPAEVGSTSVGEPEPAAEVEYFTEFSPFTPIDLPKRYPEFVWVNLPPRLADGQPPQPEETTG